MADLVWLDEARDDVSALLSYISDRDPKAALRYVEGLERACQKLIEFPEIGRRFNASYRCLVYRNHLILYAFDEQDAQVRIAAVVDGRRDITELIEG